MVDNANEETKSSSFVANSDHSSNESVSNQSLDSQRTPEENLNKHIKLKLLIPSIAAGSIIGKNGETISQIQAQTQARVKLSKPDELYPGTNDRVCLLSGTKNSILQLYDFISEKIREKPDVKVDCRGSYPRHMQVKIIVSSSTAGMIIGKGGVVIKDIKKTTNAFIQLSQKPEYSEIQERCVILAGEPNQTRPIVEIILNKILQDTNDAPLSDIVYLNPFTTPSPFPTGSPYAASNSAPHGPFDPLVHNTNQYSALTAVNSQASPNSNHLSHPGSNSNGFNTLINHNRFYSGTNGQRMPGNNQRFQFPGLFKYPNRSALQSQGYPDCAIDEIISALNVLNMYGFKLRNLSPDHYDRNPMQRLALPPTSSTHQTNYLLSNKSNPNDSMSLINHLQRNIDNI